MFQQALTRIRPKKDYKRSQLVDVLRGSGIIMMVVFHFAYDLTLFGLADIPIYSDFSWIAFRFVILSCFLITCGAALALHHQRGMNYPKYWRRVIIVAANAYLITLATYLTLGDKFVFFGILHLIALSSVIGLAFVRFYWLNLALGLGILYLGYNLRTELFNNPWLNWIGMLPEATGAADYTPIFPFFGLVLLGIFLARLLGDAIYLRREGFVKNQLARIGQYSLIIYMTHQPILWLLLYLFTRISAGQA